MSILNVDKIQPIGGGSTITVDATDIQASTGTIRASTFSGDVSATGIGVTSLNVAGVVTATSFVGGLPITSGVDNRVITASSASAIQGEANLTFNGSILQVTGQGVFSSVITASTYIQGTSSNGGLKFYSDSSASKGVILNTDDHLVPSNDSNSDLGLTGTRWRNVYADTYYGDGSNLSNITSTTINSNADNRVITGSGTANTLNGEANLTFDGTSLSLGAHRDIRFTTGNWTGEHAGKIQFHDNRIYFQSGSNGWNFRNSSGSTIIDITAAGAISGQPLTLQQNLTLNNVTTIGVGKDLRFSQGNWTGEVAGKIQFHSNFLYFQGGTGGFYFRNPSGVNVLSIDVNGHISTSNAPITFNSDCLFNGGSDAVEIAAHGDIKLNNGNWSGEKTYKIQAHSSTMYLQAPAFIFRDDGGSNRWAINSSGHFNPGTNNTYDIGSSSYRIRNIYTNDLNLSNEGSTNSVDNTWGNYTIQEGESDLFLINNRSGKKYKFNLTEVS